MSYELSFDFLPGVNSYVASAYHEAEPIARIISYFMNVYTLLIIYLLFITKTEINRKDACEKNLKTLNNHNCARFQAVYIFILNSLWISARENWLDSK